MYIRRISAKCIANGNRRIQVAISNFFPQSDSAMVHYTPVLRTDKLAKVGDNSYTTPSQRVYYLILPY